MLHVIKTQDDPLMKFIKDDPVRPEIPAEWRVSQNREILTLVDEHKNPLAMVCVAFCDTIPSSVEELLIESTNPHVAIFYTIWSYANGGGRSLIQEARNYIQDTYNHITRFVTLSPQTELAERFHHKNGAKTFRQNSDTVNYEYE
jgi:Malonyl-CoA decarboxylase C-terminal domain